MKGRKIRLKDTGEIGNSLEAYKGEDGKYYSSKEAYDVLVNRRNLYKEIYSLLQNILGIDESCPVPPVIIKLVNKYSERYDIIKEILLRDGDSLNQSIKSKEINNPFNQARYIQAVIENNYGIIENEFDMIAKAKLQRQDYHEPPSDISHLGHKNKHKDINDLIGGFSWS